MSKQQKLIDKLFNTQKGMRWSELVTLLAMLGYIKLEGSGSRIKFSNGNPRNLISLHKPHPGNEIPAYVKRVVINKLKMAGLQ